MAEITLKGNPIHTAGELPSEGSQAPAFKLTNTDLQEVGSHDFNGQRLVLNIFPSIDTPTCATSVRRFNEAAAKLPNTQVLCVSMDLPFAQKRFCGAEGIDNVVSVSGFRHPEFGDEYGLTILDGPLNGLYSRAVVVIDEQGKVAHAEQVPEIAQEPDYDAALKAVGA